MVILIIDDDPTHLHLLERMLKGSDAFLATGGGPRLIRTYSDPAEAIAEFPAEGPVVTLCDYQMPGADGLDWLPDFVRFDLGPVIVLSSHGDERVASNTFRAGASDYLNKSVVFKNPNVLHHAIRDGLRRHKLDLRNRQLSRELKQSNIALENKNRRLTELTETAHRFVDNVAHEFRTPLTVIKEFASIIRDGLGGPVTDDQEGFLDYIDAATRDLSQMVDDFLDTSKLRANRLRVDRKPHSIAELFESVRATIHTRANTKSVHIEETIAAGLPEVYCDLEKAGRALINLVSNAVKFSPEGSNVGLTATLNEEGDVSVNVIDQGPGLSEDDIAVIGERFEQLKNNESKAGKGFGLGLNIARDLAKLNLGKLDVASELGHGSTFSFTLPHWDPLHILKRYLEVQTADRGGFELSLLQAKPDNPQRSLDEICTALASSGHSMDLTVPAADGQSVLLIGHSTEPQAWCKKIAEGWLARGADQSKPPRGPLDVQWIASWAIPTETDQAVTAVTNQLNGVRACA